jgi:hypothetical protein
MRPSGVMMTGAARRAPVHRLNIWHVCVCVCNQRRERAAPKQRDKAINIGPPDVAATGARADSASLRAGTARRRAAAGGRACQSRFPKRVVRVRWHRAEPVRLGLPAAGHGLQCGPARRRRRAVTGCAAAAAQPQSGPGRPRPAGVRAGLSERSFRQAGLFERPSLSPSPSESAQAAASESRPDSDPPAGRRGHSTVTGSLAIWPGFQALPTPISAFHRYRVT